MLTMFMRYRLFAIGLGAISLVTVGTVSMSTLEARVAIVREEVEKNRNRISRLFEEVAANREEIRALKEQISRLPADAGANVSSEIAALDSRLDRLEQRILEVPPVAPPVVSEPGEESWWSRYLEKFLDFLFGPFLYLILVVAGIALLYWLYKKMKGSGQSQSEGNGMKEEELKKKKEELDRRERQQKAKESELENRRKALDAEEAALGHERTKLRQEKQQDE